MSNKPNPVNWFEIPVSDIARAKAFYEAAFDTTLTEMEMGPNKLAMFPMDHETPGAPGALIQAESFVPSVQGTLIYFSVPSIDESLEKIGSAGGKTLMPKTSIGEFGQIAFFGDTEGNRVGIHEAPAAS